LPVVRFLNFFFWFLFQGSEPLTSEPLEVKKTTSFYCFQFCKDDDDNNHCFLAH